MTKDFCDRCGKEGNTTHIRVSPETIFDPLMITDLCADCLNKFKDWVVEAGEKQPLADPLEGSTDR